MDHKDHHNYNGHEECKVDSIDEEIDAKCNPDEVDICQNGVDGDNLESIIEEPKETPDSKISSLEQKVIELKDMYVRSQAEMQNTHKRNQEELKKAKEYAISNFAKELVTVRDYLEMALKDETGNFETLKMGVDLTLKQLIQVFEGQKIKEIAPKALDKLDPHLHQAMNTIEVEGQETNTVVSVMQKGYILHDRVLRPAMVTVAK